MMLAEVRACLDVAIPASLEAGRAIMAVYEESECIVMAKSDDSPLTCADQASHDIIMSFLFRTPWPVLSEEGRHIAYSERMGWSSLWIVDPLDGTKEFIKRNGEFTVNIALVQDGVPVCGVIYVPVTRELYFGAQGFGSYRCVMMGNYEDFEAVMSKSDVLPLSLSRSNYVIMGSRSHGSAEMDLFVSNACSEHSQVEVVPAGSSLKICRVVEGLADIYPRLGPTMEWDTAAGHAIAKGVGKKLTDWRTGEELRYNKENLTNPWFVIS